MLLVLQSPHQEPRFNSNAHHTRGLSTPPPLLILPSSPLWPPLHPSFLIPPSSPSKRHRRHHIRRARRHPRPLSRHLLVGTSHPSPSAVARDGVIDPVVSVILVPAIRCKRPVCGGARSHILPTSTRAFQLNASVDARGCRRASLARTPSPARFFPRALPVPVAFHVTRKKSNDASFRYFTRVLCAAPPPPCNALSSPSCPVSSPSSHSSSSVRSVLLALWSLTTVCRPRL